MVTRLGREGENVTISCDLITKGGTQREVKELMEKRSRVSVPNRNVEMSEVAMNVQKADRKKRQQTYWAETVPWNGAGRLDSNPAKKRPARPHNE